MRRARRNLVVGFAAVGVLVMAIVVYESSKPVARIQPNESARASRSAVEQEHFKQADPFVNDSPKRFQVATEMCKRKVAWFAAQNHYDASYSFVSAGTVAVKIDANVILNYRAKYAFGCVVLDENGAGAD